MSGETRGTRGGWTVLLLGAVLLAVGLGAPPAPRAEGVTLKMAHFMPVMHIQHQKSFLPFAQRVEALSGGAVKIRIFPGGTLGDATQLAEATRAGIADLAFVVPSYTTGRFPRSAAFDLPFLFENAVHATQVYYDLYEGFLAEDFRDYKVLWFLSCGPGQFHAVRRPIRTLEDLKGMKMRSSSASMSRAFSLWGANPVSMPLPELQGALKRNILDGMLTPASAIADFKLVDTIRHLTEAKVYISVMAVLMNKERFAALPAVARQALEAAGGQAWGFHSARLYDAHDRDTIAGLAAAGKVSVYRLPATQKARLVEAVRVMERDWIAENERRGLPARALMEAVHRSAERRR